jgi:hypothetical protein
VEPHDLHLGAQVHFVVAAGVETVLRGQTILAHHDHGRLERREEREHEVQEDERVRIERRGRFLVDNHPEDQPGDE